MNLQQQADLTTQVMEFTNETRTAIVVAAYKAVRLGQAATPTDAIKAMLDTEIELFMDENPELFAQPVEPVQHYSIFSDPDRFHDSL